MKNHDSAVAAGYDRRRSLTFRTVGAHRAPLQWTALCLTMTVFLSGCGGTQAKGEANDTQ